MKPGPARGQSAGMSTMTRRGAGWVAAVAIGAALLSGCTGEPEPVGELVGSWSQGGEPSWVDDMQPIPTTLVVTDAEREEWLADLPDDVGADPSFDELRDVDLGESFLVIGGYPRCTEESVVVVDGETVAFEVRTEDENVACAWSPYTIDAWAVPLTATGGLAPESVAGPEDG